MTRAVKLLWALESHSKGELKAALKAGGFQNGVKTCNTIAPELAKQASNKSGVKISRTSLKLRNPENALDEWEITVLKQFEERKAKGESPKKMEHSEVVDANGENSTQIAYSNRMLTSPGLFIAFFATYK